METDPRRPAWRTMVATLAGYVLILVAIALVVFVVPYLIFAAT